jgi:transcriptional regulator with XRE-family HTH domain
METDRPGTRVARNVQTLRKLRGLTVRDLSARMGKIGRPVLPSGITKIEQGHRRVDADDLVALAVALEVTPNRLLLTEEAREDHRVALADKVGRSEADVWRWATGECPLPRRGSFNWREELEFPRMNRPHIPPQPTGREMDDLREAGKLKALTEGYWQARDAGVSHAQAAAWLEMLGVMSRVSTWARERSEGGGDGER